MAIAFAERAVDLYNGVATFAFDNQEALVVTVGLVVLGAVAFVLRKERRKLKKLWRLRRGKQMTRKEYLHHVKTKVGSRFADLMEDMEADGEIKRSDVRWMTRRFTRVLEVRDLLPPKKNPPPTDDELKALRLQYLRKKVSIPGPKPGEKVELPVSADNVVQITTGTRKGFGTFARKRA